MRPNFRARFRAQAPQAHQDTQPPTQHQTAHHQAKAKKVGFFYGRRWLLLVIILLIAAIAGMTYMYIHTKNQLSAAKNPAAAGKTEIEQIENQISGAVALPSDETPTLYTVSNVSKLKNQAFFMNAQNGDKVLVYNKAGYAVLYRPSTKKAIEYAPISIGNNQ